jgi:hypothetical protein
MTTEPTTETGTETASAVTDTATTEAAVASEATTVEVTETIEQEIPATVVDETETITAVSIGLYAFSTVNSFHAGEIVDVDTIRKHLVVKQADSSHEIIDTEGCFAYGNPQIGDYFVVTPNIEFYIGKVLFEELFFPPAK